jgi:hypothetical protein
MEKIKSDTPLMMLTVSQFQTLVASCFAEKPESKVQVQPPVKRYVYGLKGICDLFGCAHSTAQHLKDNVITKAVSQNGRKIMVDVDLALQLFQENKKHNN